MLKDKGTNKAFRFLQCLDPAHGGGTQGRVPIYFQIATMCRATPCPFPFVLHPEVVKPPAGMSPAAAVVGKTQDVLRLIFLFNGQFKGSGIPCKPFLHI